MIYSGIDLHETNMVITTIDSNGAELACAKLPCRKAEVSAYFSRFTRSHRAVVESTGSWYWLSDLLSAIGVELILAHALQLKAISYAKVKTDAVDAAMLAELLRVGLIPEAHQISPAMRSLREVMRTRLRLVVRRTAARVQVHCLAEKAGWQLTGREMVPNRRPIAGWTTFACWRDKLPGLKDGCTSGWSPTSRSNDSGKCPVLG